MYPLSNFYVTKEAAIGISFKRVRKTTSERKKGSANSKDQMKEMMLMLMLMLMMMVVVEKKLTKFDWPCDVRGVAVETHFDSYFIKSGSAPHFVKFDFTHVNHTIQTSTIFLT